MASDDTPQDNEPFGMVVRFTLKDGGGPGFDDLMRDTVVKIRAHEPRTLAYVVQSEHDDPTVRIFYELYADQAAFQHHQDQDYIEYFKQQRDNFVSKVEVDRLSVITSAGIAETQT